MSFEIHALGNARFPKSVFYEGNIVKPVRVQFKSVANEDKLEETLLFEQEPDIIEVFRHGINFENYNINWIGIIEVENGDDILLYYRRTAPEDDVMFQLRKGLQTGRLDWVDIAADLEKTRREKPGPTSLPYYFRFWMCHEYERLKAERKITQSEFRKELKEDYGLDVSQSSFERYYREFKRAGLSRK